MIYIIRKLECPDLVDTYMVILIAVLFIVACVTNPTALVLLALPTHNFPTLATVNLAREGNNWAQENWRYSSVASSRIWSLYQELLKIWLTFNIWENNLRRRELQEPSLPGHCIKGMENISEKELCNTVPIIFSDCSILSLYFYVFLTS